MSSCFLLIGFPIALILAWALRRDAARDSGHGKSSGNASSPQSYPARRRQRDNFYGAGFFLLPRASARKIDKSIAVLPFQNLSEEKANAYFADGIQNEILTRLATVRDLKVISRTSTAKYQSKPDNLKAVAQELGVSTILEGAVQKSWRQSSGERAVNRCTRRYASLGEKL